MSKQLDRLFKEKLANHQVQPSEAAWSKVEASLASEKKGIVWFRAAAAIVLLGLLTVTILWVRSGEEKTNALAKVDSARVMPKVKIVPVPKKTQKTYEPKLPVVKSPSRKMKVYIAQQPTKKEIEQPLQQEQTVAIVQETEQPLIQVEQPQVKPKRAIVLTYTLAQIPLQEERSVAAVEEKKGLQKMVNMAREAKHSEGALTELRTIKDELFALNFKKESNRK